jgi:DNA polymerase-3 subunit epsilon
VAGKVTFAMIAHRLVVHLDGCDLCGFNILAFDLKMLVAECKRSGVEFPLAGRRIIDAYRIYADREPRDLAAAVRFYCGREHEGAHGAEADVLATRAILDAQVTRYNLPGTVAELYEQVRDPTALDIEGKFRRRPDGVVVFNFWKYAGRPVDEVARTDPSALRWMLGKDFLDDAKAIAREVLDRVAPTDLG